jgi:hypothetical protein
MTPTDATPLITLCIDAATDESRIGFDTQALLPSFPGEIGGGWVMTFCVGLDDDDAMDAPPVSATMYFGAQQAEAPAACETTARR